MKIALIQINPVIGDFRYNCEKIFFWTKRAKESGCKLVIFPEMAVSGYPPQDLLERRSFIARQSLAVEELVAGLPGDIDILFGCFEQRSAKEGKHLYNAALVARDGKIVFRAHKQLLPAYDVFDETRYFQQGDVPQPYVVEGKAFGITICEDIWHQEMETYAKEPVVLLKQKATAQNISLDCIINISASPFQRDKEVQRQALFKRLCRRHSLPLIYVNQVGGQDSLLFDGRSLVMDEHGEILAKSVGFEENITIINSIDWRGEMAGPPVDDELESVFSALVMGVRD